MSLPAVQPEVVLTSQEKLLAEVQKKYPGYHPVLAMVEMAFENQRAGDEADPHLQFACHKEAAKYLVKVDKSVEVKAEVKQTKRVVVELFGHGEQQDNVPGPQPLVLENEASPVLEGTAAANRAVQDVEPRRVGVSLMEHEEAAVVRTVVSGEAASELVRSFE